MRMLKRMLDYTSHYTNWLYTWRDWCNTNGGKYYKESIKVVWPRIKRAPARRIEYIVWL